MSFRTAIMNKICLNEFMKVQGTSLWENLFKLSRSVRRAVTAFFDCNIFI